jgi:hypothetical protein
VKLVVGIIRVAPALEIARIAWTEGGIEGSGRRKIEEPEKKLDTDEMRSVSTVGVFNTTPETPLRTLSDTALTLPASNRRISLSAGTVFMMLVARDSGTTTFSTPASSQFVISVDVTRDCWSIR